MANFRGQDGSVTFATNPVGEVKGWSLTTAIDIMDDSVMGDAWKTFVPGLAEWSGTVDVQLDYGDTLGQKAIIDKLITATPGVATTAINFRISATKLFSGNVLVTNVEPVVRLGEIVGAKLTFKGVGAPAISWA